MNSVKCDVRVFYYCAPLHHWTKATTLIYRLPSQLSFIRLRFRLLFDWRATATARSPPSWWGAAAERSDRVSGCDSGGGTPLRRAAVWTSRPDCVNLGRYRVRKRMYNNNNNIISFVFDLYVRFSFSYLFFPCLSLLSRARTHARWTRRVYDRAPDRVLGSAETPVAVSLQNFRFVFFSKINLDVRDLRG